MWAHSSSVSQVQIGVQYSPLRSAAHAVTISSARLEHTVATPSPPCRPRRRRARASWAERSASCPNVITSITPSGPVASRTVTAVAWRGAPPSARGGVDRDRPVPSRHHAARPEGGDLGVGVTEGGQHLVGVLTEDGAPGGRTVNGSPSTITGVPT